MITVLTPTYNRKEKLVNLFLSLTKQSNKKFEWIVIDDGSTDKTKEYIDSLNADFHIEYVKKNNGGKHTALNFSHDYIHGDYVVIVDSDDVLINCGIEEIYNEILKYKNDNVSIFIFQRGSVKNPNTPLDYSMGLKRNEGSLYEFLNNGMKGDHCEVFKSEYFKKCKFPEYSGEKFMGELWAWLKISEYGKCVIVNKVIYLCDYLDGGLTKSGRLLRLKNPCGGQEHAIGLMSRQLNFKIRIKNSLLYVAYGFVAKQSVLDIFKNNENKILISFAFLPAWVLYKYWMIKYSIK